MDNMDTMDKVVKKCGTCEFFMGCGDWNLCCSKPHPEYQCGFLCYEDTDACDMYEKSTPNKEFKPLPRLNFLDDLSKVDTKMSREEFLEKMKSASKELYERTKKLHVVSIDERRIGKLSDRR